MNRQEEMENIIEFLKSVKEENPEQYYNAINITKDYIKRYPEIEKYQDFQPKLPFSILKLGKQITDDIVMNHFKLKPNSFLNEKGFIEFLFLKLSAAIEGEKIRMNNENLRKFQRDISETDKLIKFSILEGTENFICMECGEEMYSNDEYQKIIEMHRQSHYLRDIGKYLK